MKNNASKPASSKECINATSQRTRTKLANGEPSFYRMRQASFDLALDGLLENVETGGHLHQGL